MSSKVKCHALLRNGMDARNVIQGIDEKCHAPTFSDNLTLCLYRDRNVSKDTLVRRRSKLGVYIPSIIQFNS